MAQRQIQLVPEYQRVFAQGYHDAFRLRITAQNAVGMPNEVFAFLEVPLQPGTANMTWVFDHICSAIDLEDYPIGSPLPNADPPWFRTAQVTIDEPTREQAMETFDAIMSDIRILIRSMDASDVLDAVATVWLYGSSLS